MKYLFILVLVTFTLFSCQDKDALEKANQFYNNGDYNKAVKSYSNHIKMNPFHEIAFYNRGRAFEELGQYEKAAFSDNRSDGRGRRVPRRSLPLSRLARSAARWPRCARRTRCRPPRSSRAARRS